MIVENILTGHEGKMYAFIIWIRACFVLYFFLLRHQGSIYLSSRCLTVDVLNEGQDEQHRHPATKSTVEMAEANLAEL